MEPGNTTNLDPYSPEGCFIATAAYGTETHQRIDILRDFRDDYMKKNMLGRLFVKNYYRFSPPVADFIAKRKYLQTATKVLFVEPLCKVVNKLFFRD